MRRGCSPAASWSGRRGIPWRFATLRVGTSRPRHDRDVSAALPERHRETVRGCPSARARDGRPKMGTIGLDGTKIHANASRHSALSYEHAGKIEAQLKAEVVDLMAKAEAADATDIPMDHADPDELARREERLRRIAEARGRSRRGRRSAMRARWRSTKSKWRRVRPRSRRRARSLAASRRSRRSKDRGRAIRSI